MTQPESMGETIPEDVLAIGESIARDLPYRVGPKSREFAAAVIARAILAERMAERERCADQMRINMDNVQLHMGELSAQEKRTIRAFALWKFGAIRKPTP